MRYWLVGLFVGAAAILLGQELPGVDFSGLTAAKKAVVMKVLGTVNCPCGCGMKLAECRVKDPACSYSKGLAGVAVDSAKSGKSPDDILTAVNASPLMHKLAPKLLENPVSIPTQGNPVIGPENARITLVEFSDFQCPYCSEAVGKLKAVMQAYPTQVKLIFKQFPLDIHSQAQIAAQAAIAAQQQGKFWEMHDAMFADRRHLQRQDLLALAAKLGMDQAKFQKALDSPAVKQAVAKDQTEGEKAGVDSTPSVFVNGQKYNGSLDLAPMKSIIDAELKKAAAKK